MAIFIETMYFVVLLVFVSIGFFVMYHLLRYSLTKQSAIATILIFLPVFFILLFSNIIIFFSLDFQQILPLFMN